MVQIQNDNSVQHKLFRHAFALLITICPCIQHLQHFSHNLVEEYSEKKNHFLLHKQLVSRKSFVTWQKTNSQSYTYHSTNAIQSSWTWASITFFKYSMTRSNSTTMFKLLPQNANCNWKLGLDLMTWLELLIHFFFIIIMTINNVKRKHVQTVCALPSKNFATSSTVAAQGRPLRRTTNPSSHIVLGRCF